MNDLSSDSSPSLSESTLNFTSGSWLVYKREVAAVMFA
jgi:hypothetical protein